MILEKTFSKVARKIGLKLLLSKVRDAADGKLGPVWKARYWWLAGKKTWTGVVVAIAAAVAVGLGYSEVAVGIGSIAVLAVEAGVLDKAWRTEIPPELTNSAAFKFLAAHSADLATILGLVAAGLNDCATQACHYGQITLTVVGIGLVQLGLLSASWKSKPPEKPPETR